MISILLVNYNGLRHLEECLTAIYAQTYADFEVVMVDNASSDGSVAYVEAKFPKVRIIRSDTNRGFAGGNNLGIPACKGEYIFFLNNDTRIEPDALGALALAIREFPQARVFASFLINYREPELADSAGDTLYTNGVPFGFSRYPARLFDRPREVTAACAGAALYHRDVLEALGGFDEDFFLLFEDLDLSFRARHAGEKIMFIPASRVHHKGSASLGGKASFLSLYYCERNIWLFFAKNLPAPILFRMLPDILIMKAYRLYSTFALGQPWAFFKGTWDSLLMLPRMLPKRRRILSASKIPAGEFKALLRKGWFRERRAFKRADFSNVPL